MRAAGPSDGPSGASRAASAGARPPGQPWIHSAGFDGAMILAPALVATAAVYLFRDALAADPETPFLAWFLLVVAIDVAHVYSTIFRTYLDRAELRRRRELYLLTPALAWLAGVLLYALGKLVFWRVLAYLAVFHFVRQQYGFVMLYKRHERAEPRWARRLDQLLIYAATLCPLIYWHTHAPATIHWFIEGDFFTVDAPWLSRAAFGVYAVLIVAYAVKELRAKAFNIPKNMLILGTAASWFTGIVALRGDFAFTATNVVAHGIPYIGLIWAHGRRTAARRAPLGIAERTGARWFRWAWIPLFVGVLLLLGYIEEGLWDGLVWRDHEAGFPVFSHLPRVTDTALLTFIVPLLAVPQITHYILDGFIWKVRRLKEYGSQQARTRTPG